MTTLAELRQANLKEQNTPEKTPEAIPPPPVPAAEVAPPVIDPAPSLRLTVAETAPTEDPDTLFLARVREALGHKVIHPTGAKATVDMTPVLFHRAKRYCNAHGNISLRQVFLELLTAFLDEEGY